MIDDDGTRAQFPAGTGAEGAPELDPLAEFLGLDDAQDQAPSAPEITPQAPQESAPLNPSKDTETLNSQGNVINISSAPARAREATGNQANSSKTRSASDEQAGETNAETDGPDWEAIEHDYRVGVLSVRAIAAKHGCHFSTVYSRIEKYDWKRDLSDKARKRAQAILSNEAATPENAADQASREAAAVEGAAAQQVEVVRQHRKDLAQLRALQAQLVARAGDRFKLKSMLKSAAELREASQTIDALARVVGRVIPLERQAFNLDAERGPATEATAIAQRVKAFQESRQAADKPGAGLAGRVRRESA